MKRLFTLFTFAFAALAIANAQPTPIDVVPGSKGELPQLQELSVMPEGRFAGLTLERITTSYSWFGGQLYSDREAWLPVPSPETYGAEYYELQYRLAGSTEWLPMLDEYDNMLKYENVSIMTPRLSATTDYRIVLHGGPMDGCISNEVTANVGVLCGAVSSASMSTPNFYVVGNPVDACQVCSYVYDAEKNRVDYGYDHEYIRHQWYRRNPNTGEMTIIQGATGLQYTPTVEDAGYEIVDVTFGDGQHIDFQYTCVHGTVILAVCASLAYLGDDGFILNTDYVIPSPETSFKLSDVWGENGDVVLDASSVTTIKPGQYAIHTSDYDGYEIGFMADGSNLCFVYDWSYEGDSGEYIENYTYREAQIMQERYKSYVDVNVFGPYGEPVGAVVDVLRRNIDGKLAVVESQQFMGDTLNFHVYCGECYVKVRATDNSLETYYPNSLLWSDATPVVVSQERDDNWDLIVPCIEIQAQAALPELTGSGVIEGAVSVGDATRAAASDDTYTVYLREKDGNIVAMTQTDAEGKFRFDKVPFGDYEVVVNIDGVRIDAPAEVTLSEQQPTVTGVDYSLSGTALVTSSITSLAADGASRADCFDLFGRRTTSDLRGISIERNANGKCVKRIK